MAFDGWPAESLAFYAGLEDDNSKEYWTSRKAVYQEQVLRPMEELLEELAPEFGEPKIFRPYRDIRFSHDKTPYKTHIGATLGSTCYVQLSADGLSAGAGRWHLEPAELTLYRAGVAGADGAELAAIVAGLEKAGVEVHGHGTLKSAPRGYSADQPPNAMGSAYAGPGKNLLSPNGFWLLPVRHGYLGSLAADQAPWLVTDVTTD